MLKYCQHILKQKINAKDKDEKELKKQKKFLA